ncbi:farnesyl cysteine-carboxyl methyltransferase, mediates the carboxyl methylation step during C-termin [Anaeromyces robustus]|uniref:Protein-S-isoprenylcysteine O-methyltransferase n=1 Tax=Anaeromyces robustus TaxID=1754192 RepID=A0A1Y1XPJ7_9FUNG|nr:farnesyl cysteine-carboxyl methyltransferase, mediates the carboxyl methylation step during C-termin [Anaeromyces robustus]|eukprot:ORX87667.1 farnesyl cysteine-carboxyl methyltransferase, mediates the carboxyl methylation step during C-termin [Anaeromyces robustus]
MDNTPPKKEEKKEENNIKNNKIDIQSIKRSVVKYCYENKILEGTLNPQNVAVISYILGLVGGICFILIFNKKYGNFFCFIFFLSIYHNMEFVSTAAFKREVCSIDSYLLNHSGAYHFAMGAGMVEYWVERLIFKNAGWKGFNVISIIGLILTIAGQIIRSTAMFTCKSNFSHHIEEYKRPEHVLVKTGIYKYLRHPSYTGFFYWGIGCQMLLMNPISFIGYLVVLYRFFNERIQYEEDLLVDFFGDEYVEYRKTSKVYIPGIN